MLYDMILWFLYNCLCNTGVLAPIGITANMVKETCAKEVGKKKVTGYNVELWWYKAWIYKLMFAFLCGVFYLHIIPLYYFIEHNDCYALSTMWINI